MFGKDVATIALERTFDLFGLLESFATEGQTKVVYPEILPVLTTMLQSGLKAIARDQNDPDSPSAEVNNGSAALQNEGEMPSKSGRTLFTSPNTDISSSGEP